MAWGWWRRRRWGARRWRRRRRRRRPVWRRRPRRPVRRRRRRQRTVRRRRGRYTRRRRGWGRRRTVRRRRRKKLYLTQWNPPIVKHCFIKGALPLILCGSTRANMNYAMHCEDSTPQPEPFGGGMSTVTFSLLVLYDQHERHLNRWSFPNDQLDLVRYKHVRFKFYRSKDTDFIVTYNIKPPMKMNETTSPNAHPGMAMQMKHKILIPSFQTRPGGRRYVSVKIGPPKLFEDKWYPQSDFCKVALVSLTATACDFRHPFCSPQTNNPCTTFQVLREQYNKVIGFPMKGEEAYTDFELWLYESGGHYQTFQTEAQFRVPAHTPWGSPNSNKDNWQQMWSGTDGIYKKKTDSNFGYHSFQVKGKKSKITARRDIYFKWETTFDKSTTHLNPTWQPGHFKQYEYHFGWFSPIFIGPNRYMTQFRPAYYDVTYNPFNDKGKGNMVWFQYLTKPDTEFDPIQCKCVLLDIPLWAAFFGYPDYIESQLGPFQDHETVGIVCFVCPYTQPPMYKPGKVQSGYVFYDTNFGNGKMPSGLGQIPVFWQSRWRPYLKWQLQVMNDISKTGPFSYRDELKQAQLCAMYSFKFLFGGDLLYPQIIKNPCGDSGVPSSPSRQPRGVQVTNPLSMAPQFIFHKFDSRRGFYSSASLKRMLQQPKDDELYLKKPKFPRLLTALQGDQGQEDSFSSQETSEQSSQEEKEAEAPQTQTQIQQQLRHQLKQQIQLRNQLQLVMFQLSRTQANLHLNPLSLAHLT
nr:ORF1 [Torque teno virus 16]